jgi:hypothetical protein
MPAALPAVSYADVCRQLRPMHANPLWQFVLVCKAAAQMMAQRRATVLQGGFNTAEASLAVAVPEVVEGTLLQLHVRDSHWSQKGVKTSLQVRILLLLTACFPPSWGSWEHCSGLRDVQGLPCSMAQASQVVDVRRSTIPAMLAGVCESPVWRAGAGPLAAGGMAVLLRRDIA